MQPNGCVAAYCRAQLELNDIDKQHHAAKKVLNERIRSGRSIVLQECEQKLIDSFQVYNKHDEGQPQYFIIKKSHPKVNVTSCDIHNALRTLDFTSLMETPQVERDLPKMVAVAIMNVIQQDKKPSTAPKMTLQISNTPPSGGVSTSIQHISEDMRRVSEDIVTARHEMSLLRKTIVECKKPGTTIQKSVELVVKETLFEMDPSHMKTRVQMKQHDCDWIYYLRCKKVERQVPIGIRKASPIVECAVSALMEERGMTRICSPGLIHDQPFWAAVAHTVGDKFETAASEKKTVTKLTLDRGAPLIAPNC